MPVCPSTQATVGANIRRYQNSTPSPTAYYTPTPYSPIAHYSPTAHNSPTTHYSPTALPPYSHTARPNSPLQPSAAHTTLKLKKSELGLACGTVAAGICTLGAMEAKSSRAAAAPAGGVLVRVTVRSGLEAGLMLRGGVGRESAQGCLEAKVWSSTWCGKKMGVDLCC